MPPAAPLGATGPCDPRLICASFLVFCVCFPVCGHFLSIVTVSAAVPFVSFEVCLLTSVAAIAYPLAPFLACVSVHAVCGASTLLSRGVLLTAVVFDIAMGEVSVVGSMIGFYLACQFQIACLAAVYVRLTCNVK